MKAAGSVADVRAHASRKGTRASLLGLPLASGRVTTTSSATHAHTKLAGKKTKTTQNPTHSKHTRAGSRSKHMQGNFAHRVLTQEQRVCVKSGKHERTTHLHT